MCEVSFINKFKTISIGKYCKSNKTLHLGSMIQYEQNIAKGQ